MNWTPKDRLIGATHRYHVGPWETPEGGKTMSYLTKRRAQRAAETYGMSTARLSLRSRTGMKIRKNLGITIL